MASVPIDNNCSLSSTCGDDPSKVEASGSGVTGPACVKAPAEVLVDTTKAGVAPLSAKVTSPSGEAAEVELKPTDEEGIFKGAYSPKEIGHYGLEVNFADEPIPKSPFFVPVCDPAAVRLDGPGLECAVKDADNVVDVYTDNAGPADVEVQISGPPDAPQVDCCFKKLDDNHKQIHYTPHSPGNYELQVTYGGFPVGEKKVVPCVDPTKVRLDGPGVDNGILVNEPTEFTIDTTEAGPGPVDVQIKDADGMDVPCEVSETCPGNFKCKYAPKKSGNQEIDVKLAGHDVANTPLFIHVSETGMFAGDPPLRHEEKHSEGEELPEGGRGRSDSGGEELPEGGRGRSGIGGELLERGRGRSGIGGELPEGGRGRSGIGGELLERGRGRSGIGGELLERGRGRSGIGGELLEGGRGRSGIGGELLEGGRGRSGIGGELPEGGRRRSGSGVASVRNVKVKKSSCCQVIIRFVNLARHVYMPKVNNALREKLNVCGILSLLILLLAMSCLYPSLSYQTDLDLCGNPPNMSNGSFVITNDSVAEYRCDIGFRPQELKLQTTWSLTCNRTSGSWTGTSAVCKIMDCGKPACPSNGDVHFTETTFSSTCTFTCSVGHRMQGGSTSMCEEDGKWTGYPLCKVVNCSRLKDPTNGGVKSNEVRYNSTATYECLPGYELKEGDKTRMCLANGSWSGSSPICVLITKDDVVKKINDIVEYALKIATEQNMVKQKKRLFNIGKTLRTRRLRAGLIGLVKSGKSSLLNALLRQEMLPTSIQPQTVLETVIIHSDQDQEELDCFYKDGNLSTVAKGSSDIYKILLDHNDKAREKKSYECAQFRLKSKFFFLDESESKSDILTLEISDTAGPDEAGNPDAFLKTTAAIEDFSAFIIILNYRRMKSKSEVELLEHIQTINPRLLDLHDRFLFVVNAIDAYYADGNKDSVAPEDVSRYVARYLTDALRVQIPEDRIITFSAKWALKCQSFLATDVDGLSDADYFEALSLYSKIRDVPSKQFQKPSRDNKVVVLKFLNRFSHVTELEEELQQMLVKFGLNILYASAADDTRALVNGLIEHMNASVNKSKIMISEKSRLYTNFEERLANIPGETIELKQKVYHSISNRVDEKFDGLIDAMADTLMNVTSHHIYVSVNKQQVHIELGYEEYLKALEELPKLSKQLCIDKWKTLVFELKKFLESEVNSLFPTTRNFEVSVNDDMFQFYHFQPQIPMKFKSSDFAKELFRKSDGKISLYETVAVEDSWYTVYKAERIKKDLFELDCKAVTDLAASLSKEWMKDFKTHADGKMKQLRDASLDRAVKKIEAVEKENIDYVQQGYEAARSKLQSLGDEVGVLEEGLKQLDHGKKELDQVWSEYKQNISKATRLPVENKPAAEEANANYAKKALEEEMAKKKVPEEEMAKKKAAEEERIKKAAEEERIKKPGDGESSRKHSNSYRRPGDGKPSKKPTRSSTCVCEERALLVLLLVLFVCGIVV